MERKKSHKTECTTWLHLEISEQAKTPSWWKKIHRQWCNCFCKLLLVRAIRQPLRWVTGWLERGHTEYFRYDGNAFYVGKAVGFVCMYVLWYRYTKAMGFVYVCRCYYYNLSYYVKMLKHKIITGQENKCSKASKYQFTRKGKQRLGCTLFQL